MGVCCVCCVCCVGCGVWWRVLRWPRLSRQLANPLINKSPTREQNSTITCAQAEMGTQMCTHVYKHVHTNPSRSYVCVCKRKTMNASREDDLFNKGGEEGTRGEKRGYLSGMLNKGEGQVVAECLERHLQCQGMR